MSHVCNYVRDTFTTSHLSIDWNSMKTSPYSCYKYDLTTLENLLLDSEITRAIFSFKPFKVPGPDGLHPLFSKNIGILLGNPSKTFATRSSTPNKSLVTLIKHTYA